MFLMSEVPLYGGPRGTSPGLEHHLFTQWTDPGSPDYETQTPKPEPRNQKKIKNKDKTRNPKPETRNV